MFCLASVYFTALVGCAFSSPRRTADGTQQEQVAKTTIINFENVKEFEKPENTKKNPVPQIDEDSGGGNADTDMVTVKSENETSNNDTINGNTNDINIDIQLNTTQIPTENNTSVSGITDQTEDTNCSNCMTWQEIKTLKERKTVESVKQQILQKLRMKTPPKYRGTKPSLPLQELVSTYVLDEGILEKKRDPTIDLFAKNLQLFVMGKDGKIDFIFFLFEPYIHLKRM